MLKRGPQQRDTKDEAAAKVEGRRLFDLAQLDLWASLHSALQLPSPKEPSLDRVTLKAKVNREAEAYSNPVKAFVELLIYQDGMGYAALTVSLTELDRSVQAVFPSKPPQTVDNIVTLYDHAGIVETEFNQVTWSFLLLS